MQLLCELAFTKPELYYVQEVGFAVAVKWWFWTLKITYKASIVSK